MIIEITFILTAAILIMAAIKMGGAMLGNGVNMPAVIPFTDVGPTRHFLMYPSTLFQVWFWANYLEVFANV